MSRAVSLIASAGSSNATWSTISSSTAPGHYDGNGAWSLTNSNLTATVTGSSPVSATGNGAMGTGSKSYFELTVVTNTGNVILGIIQSGNAVTGAPYISSTGYCYLSTNGHLFNNSVDAGAYGSSYTAGDVIGVAFDNSNGLLWFSKNGTWQNSATISEVQAGTSTHAAFTGISGTYFPVIANVTGAAAISVTANYGASAFAATVPTGYKGLYF